MRNCAQDICKPANMPNSNIPSIPSVPWLMRAPNCNIYRLGTRTNEPRNEAMNRAVTSPPSTSGIVEDSHTEIRHAPTRQSGCSRASKTQKPEPTGMGHFFDSLNGTFFPYYFAPEQPPIRGIGTDHYEPPNSNDEVHPERADRLEIGFCHHSIIYSTTSTGISRRCQHYVTTKKKARKIRAK